MSVCPQKFAPDSDPIFRMRTWIRIRIRIRIYGNDDANQIESENVHITDADPQTHVRTLWKRSLTVILKITFMTSRDRKCVGGARKWRHAVRIELAIILGFT